VMVDKMPDNEHEEFAKALFDNDKESESVWCDKKQSSENTKVHLKFAETRAL
jgi:hypothetical protein